MKTDSIIIDKVACLGIIASAIEVYPKECMGLIFGKSNCAKIAIPLQQAKRKEKEVTSDSILFLDKFATFCGYKRICAYHSHPFDSREAKGPVEPSTVDIDGIAAGDIEIITNIRRTRKKSSLFTCSDGNINILFDNYMLEISTFMRAEPEELTYKKIPMILGE